MLLGDASWAQVRSLTLSRTAFRGSRFQYEQKRAEGGCLSFGWRLHPQFHGSGLGHWRSYRCSRVWDGRLLMP